MDFKEEHEKRICRYCYYCYEDDRSSVYSRETCFFCRKKGVFFSRNYRIGEGTRICGDDKACVNFKEKKE